MLLILCRSRSSSTSSRKRGVSAAPIHSVDFSGGAGKEGGKDGGKEGLKGSEHHFVGVEEGEGGGGATAGGELLEEGDEPFSGFVAEVPAVEEEEGNGLGGDVLLLLLVVVVEDEGGEEGDVAHDAGAIGEADKGGDSCC